MKNFKNKKIGVFSPIIKSRKGHYRELFDNLSRQGFLKARVDNNIVDLSEEIKLDRYKNHDIELLIDVINVASSNNSQNRLKESIKTALEYGNKSLMILIMDSKENSIPKFFSSNLMCETSGISYSNPEPNSFSFNSPKGMCNSCKGLGYKYFVNQEKIIPNTDISINNGGIIPLGDKKNSWTYK